MKAIIATLAGSVVILATGAAVSARQPQLELKPAESFASITDQKQRAVALFNEAGKVIQSPRCVNCHPAGDRPSQGDDGHPHQPLVVRGDAGIGAPGMRCTTCHGPANFDPGHIPGNPKWQLAPIEMAWQGKSLSEICTQIKDTDKNGGRTLAALVHHMAEDELVGWGWHPGVGRTPAPGTQKEFGELIKAWVDAGAACPAS
jgi:hypothetical protein